VSPFIAEAVIAVSPRTTVQRQRGDYKPNFADQTIFAPGTMRDVAVSRTAPGGSPGNP
jgi:hypothetical protein